VADDSRPRHSLACAYRSRHRVGRARRWRLPVSISV
jgi:hypothetical protein